jgi:hypothetical protein
MMRSSVEERAAGEHQTRASRLGDSVIWLALAGVLFTVVTLVRAPLHMPLAWDETTYIAQTSVHASPVVMPPNHSRGVGLLAAPVTLLTTSVLALRIYMAVLSGLGLFAALLCWRRVRSAWVIALAGLIFVSLAVTQLYGPLVMPNLWEALGALALAGLFLRTVHGLISRRIALPLLAVVAFFLIVVRYQDAVFVLAPVAVGIVLVRGWRDWGAAAALGIGVLAGAIEWVAEAVAFYHGPVQRWERAARLPPGIGLHFSLISQLRIIDGPVECVSGTCPGGWRYPDLTIWWVAFLVLVLVGALVARRGGISTRLCLAIGMSVLAAYGFLVPVLAGRYLLPVLAVFCILAADALAWLATRRNRFIAVAMACAGCAFVVSGAFTQAYVLSSEQVSLQFGPDLYAVEAQQLHRLGVVPPCVLKGSGTPVAYYLGCSGGTQTSKVTSADVTVMMAPDIPATRTGWREVRLTGIPHTASEHGVRVYLSCTATRPLAVCRSAAGVKPRGH